MTTVMEIKKCIEGMGAFLVQFECCSFSFQTHCILLLQTFSPIKKDPFLPSVTPKRKIQVNYRQTHILLHKLTLSGAMVQNVNKIKYNKNHFLIDVMFWSYELSI